MQDETVNSVPLYKSRTDKAVQDKPEDYQRVEQDWKDKIQFNEN